MLEKGEKWLEYCSEAKRTATEFIWKGTPTCSRWMWRNVPVQ